MALIYGEQLYPSFKEYIRGARVRPSRGDGPPPYAHPIDSWILKTLESSPVKAVLQKAIDTYLDFGHFVGTCQSTEGAMGDPHGLRKPLRRIRPATSARSDDSRAAPRCPRVVPPCWVARPGVAGGRAGVPWPAARGHGGTGAGAGAAVRNVSPRPESGPLGGPPGEQAALGLARATPRSVVAQRARHR